jgi:hypothetical protein
MWPRLAPRPQQADKACCVFQRRQLDTRPAGRLDHSRSVMASTDMNTSLNGREARAIESVVLSMAT